MKLGKMMTTSKKHRLELVKNNKIDIVEEKQGRRLSPLPDCGMMTRSKKRKLELMLMTQDRLSSLPDCILADILSNLGIEDAVATSVLSRYWRHLWKQTTRLCFRPLKFMSRETFPNYVERVNHILGQLTSQNIYSFYLELYWADHYSGRVFGTRFESLCQQLCNRNVVEIELVVKRIGYLFPIPLPTCLLQSKSLASLKLNGGLCYKLPNDGTIGFPYLKKLNTILRDCNLKNMPGILKSIPALEDLTLFLYWVKEPCVEIFAPVLKSLTIQAYRGSNSSKVMIDTPKLEFLEIKPDLLWYHFVQNPTQLRTAVISGYCGGCRDVVERHEKLDRLVSGITSVRALRLSTYLCLPVFNTASTFGKDDGVGLVSTFRNLIHLSMNCTFKKGETNWSGLIPTWVLSKLKRVEVILSCTANEDDAINLLDYILSNSNLLEQLIVSAPHGLVNGSDKIRFRSKEDIFCRALFGLSRISSNCEVEFLGHEISASSKA